MPAGGYPPGKAGPEFRAGWSGVFGAGDKQVVLLASHAHRQRPPRPHEIVRMRATGVVSMVRESEYQWRAVIPSRQILLAVVVLQPNGRYFVRSNRLITAPHEFHDIRSVGESLAAAWARHLARACVVPGEGISPE